MGNICALNISVLIKQVILPVFLQDRSSPRDEDKVFIISISPGAYKILSWVKCQQELMKELSLSLFRGETQSEESHWSHKPRIQRAENCLSSPHIHPAPTATFPGLPCPRTVWIHSRCIGITPGIPEVTGQVCGFGRPESEFWMENRNLN